uniref:Uncharacterized protein n=1 Tax=Melanopsichium pennsylvanicum 4 TaxID=1398559 RepID=A0A077R237_9BASI|nr:uncharacterized protein BN887_06006 [Melanopsichium pennsylvanicum 4]
MTLEPLEQGTGIAQGGSQTRSGFGSLRTECTAGDSKKKCTKDGQQAIARVGSRERVTSELACLGYPPSRKMDIRGLDSGSAVPPAAAVGGGNVQCRAQEG